MPVFFNGRLWITPAVMSLVDDSAMYNKNLSVGNVLAVIGRSQGGKPLSALRFGSPDEARAVLRGGDLLKAVELAFDPSAQTVGPATVVAVRVNPATQSTLTLLDAASSPSITLTSTDYGRHTDSIKVRVESGSIRGLKLSTQLGDAYYTQDNVARECFDVEYTGAAVTATITIDGGQVVLHAPAGTAVKTIDLTHFNTVEKLVDVINSVPGFDANILDANGDALALNGLDYLTAQDVKTAPLVVTGHLQAAVDWFNSMGEGFIDATRPPTAGSPPAPVNWLFLSGGTDGIVTTSEWQSAFSMLQSEDVQWVVPLSSEGAIHAMADSHAAYMSNVAGMERRVFVGGTTGLSDTQVMESAKLLNSDRTAVVHPGFYDYDERGELQLYPPYMLAAMIGGAFSGVNPGTAMTNKTLKIRGVERKLRNPTDTDQLILAGVLCVEDTPKGFKVVKSITTWRTNTNYNRVEVSVGAACDFTMRNCRNAVEDIKGQKGNPVVVRLALEKLESALKELARPEPMGPGVLVGDDESPPYRKLKATLEGDVLRLEWEASPVIPINYIPMVMHAVPWTTSVSA